MKFSTLLLMLAYIGGPGVGATAPAAASHPCPGAAAWQEAHPEDLPDAIERRDAARQFTEPDLRQALQTRFEADQRARRAYLTNPRDSGLMRAVEQMDRDNLIWLKRLIRDQGVPTAAQVGESGVKWTWLLVQHADADRDFQASVQPEFAKRYEAGELSADALAKLSDRVLRAYGKPQRFGTQFDWLSGHFDLSRVPNLAEIDEHRKSIGLMPLADYACLVNRKLADR